MFFFVCKNSKKGGRKKYLNFVDDNFPFSIVGYTHRRRIKTEEKAKVVAAVWGTELIQFFATL